MISKRLLTIASLVDNDAIVADIGSDHALLPIYLVKEKIIKKAYAIDNKEGPLQAAIENISEHNVEQSIETRLASGLSNLAEDVDTAIIAGMGYKTISAIINNDLEIAKRLNNIIIQCNNHISDLRIFLYDNQFKIIEEKIININDITYFILKIQYSQKGNNHKHSLLSNYLLSENNSDYYNYLKERSTYLEQFIEHNENAKKEFIEIQSVLNIK